MENSIVSKSVRAFAALGLLVVAGASAEKISSFPSFIPPSQGIQGQPLDFDFAWHGTTAPMADKFYAAADKMDKAFWAWNQNRSAFAPKYPGSYPEAFGGGIGSGDGRPGFKGFGHDKGEGSEAEDRDGKTGLPGTSTPAVPEPGTAFLFASGLLGVVLFARKRA